MTTERQDSPESVADMAAYFEEYVEDGLAVSLDECAHAAAMLRRYAAHLAAPADAREPARALLALLMERPTVDNIAPLHGAYEAMARAFYHGPDDGAPPFWRAMRAFLTALAADAPTPGEEGRDASASSTEQRSE